MGDAGKILAGVVGLWAVSRLMLPERNTARMIEQVTDVYARSIRIATGGDPGTPLPVCGAECWYPCMGKWDLIACPLAPGHAGLHADTNWYPFFTDADAAWYRTQYELSRLDGQ